MPVTKHTPGPWRVEGRYVMALKDKQVCEAPAYGVVHGKVDAANARLIAAAPDLLHACRKAVLALAALSETCPPLIQEYEIVSAAIAKATREEP